ncbi:hypothetical protein GQ53DRAFT_768385 [Thozetella sp. PMI_491]|nr:hypothetical protein GQ53DRAFT_768385 [Thozetella sp. PMI_491]
MAPGGPSGPGVSDAVSDVLRHYWRTREQSLRRSEGPVAPVTNAQKGRRLPVLWQSSRLLPPPAELPRAFGIGARRVNAPPAQGAREAPGRWRTALLAPYEGSAGLATGLRRPVCLALRGTWFFCDGRDMGWRDRARGGL